MVYYEADIDAHLTLTPDAGKLKFFNEADEYDVLPIRLGMNIIEIPEPVLDSEGIPTVVTKLLTLNHTEIESKDLVYIGRLNLINGINPQIISDPFSGIKEDKLLEIIHTLATVDGVDKFYYLNKASNDRAIDISPDNDILSPAVFWDKNNIVNKFTIGQIDFENSTFGVVRASYK